MTLRKLDTPTTIWPVPDHLVFEGGDIVVDIVTCSLSTASWAAYGVVLRGMPTWCGVDRHPHFTGTGGTEHLAINAMLYSLGDYFDAEEHAVPVRQ
jgi:hypothetical protein